MSRLRAVGVAVLVALAVPQPVVLAAAPQATLLAATDGVTTPEGNAPPPLTSLGAVLYDPSSDRVIWGRREHIGIPMASTTKIMTSLLAIEAETLDDTVTVSANAATQGGAGLGLHAGQTLPMRSLLAGLLMRSGNDAATTVAEHVAGSEAAFVEKMNARAAELGLEDTHFVNASGLTDDVSHRASPLDLAHLAAAAMAHEQFAKWVAARRLTVPGLPPLENRNELLANYAGANGVKTGFLEQSGYALVASAVREGLPLYAVVLGSDDNFRDAARLLDWGYKTLRLAQPAEAGSDIGPYRWADAQTPLLAAERLAAAVRRDATVVWRLRAEPAVARPVSKGALLGIAELLEDGVVVRTTTLHAGDDVPEAADLTAAPATRAGRALHNALRSFARVEPTERAA